MYVEEGKQDEMGNPLLGKGGEFSARQFLTLISTTSGRLNFLSPPDTILAAGA